jgi:arginyl-tRNA synthetase
MLYPLEYFKKEVKQVVKNALSKVNYDTSKLNIQLEKPPENMGDSSFPCFILAATVKKNPRDIAQKITEHIDITKTSWIDHVQTVGGYVNFFINTKKLAQETLNIILQKKEKYGWLEKKHKKVIIEHTSANPNGPLHVGRARNPIIGDTLVRIFRAAGYDVESQFYLDDMGKQVAMLAWGLNNIDPDLVPKTIYKKPKSDHQHVGFYQITSNRMQEDEKIAEEIGKIVKKSEQGDRATLDMIHNAYLPALEGIKESLHHINIDIENYVPESTFVNDKSVDSVVEQLKKSPHCHEEDGAFYLDLQSFGIHGRNTKFFIMRKDGTTLYATRDIAYHLWKAQQADILINVLGEDHKLESKQVEIALKLLDSKIIPKVVFYSFVSLPGGKMSTRRNRVVYLDDLMDECVDRALEEVKEISQIIGIGALRYNIIKVQPEKDIMFKWEEALNFEGDAAPFIQYAHARACSILRKSEKTNVDGYDASLLKTPSEEQLIKTLAAFPAKIEEAMNGCRPNVIANYAYSVASDFNQFYRDCPVVKSGSDTIKSRLALVQATKITLQNALQLLGIDVPEEM